MVCVPDKHEDEKAKSRDKKTETKKQRKENIRKAFEIRNVEKVKDKKIILFDDIYTTGATVNECSRILKLAGAREILVLTIAMHKCKIIGIRVLCTLNKRTREKRKE